MTEQQKKEQNVAIISGLIKEASLYEGKWYHRVMMPAADAYSSPGVCNVVSEQQLGSAGQEINVKARVSGYAKKFNRNDGSVGYDVKNSFVVPA